LKTTWRKVNDKLTLKTEEEVWLMLQTELQTQRRGGVLLRLHQRFNTLRCNRERIDIMKAATHV